MEATLTAYTLGTHFRDIPVLRMLAAPAAEIESRTRLFEQALSAAVGSGSGIGIEIVSGKSVVGGGSAPGVHPETTLIMISKDRTSVEVVEAALRRAETPVITRIVDDRVAIDLRTVETNDEAELIAALKNLAD